MGFLLLRISDERSITIDVTVMFELKDHLDREMARCLAIADKKRRDK